MPSFKNAEQVWNVTEAIRQGGASRARNRAKINAVFNGEQPFTDKEAKENRIETNVNFLEGTRIILQARQQFTTAFMQPKNVFSITYDAGPAFRRQSIGMTLTKKINRILKRDKRYMAARRNQFGSSVLHGIGPVTWLRDRDWRPRDRGIDDMLIPTNTLVSLENLTYFGIRIHLTAAELMKVISTENADSGWNRALIKGVIPMLLKRQTSAEGGQYSYDNYDFEKLVEDYKQGSLYYGSDAVPTIRCIDFYFYEADKEQWRRKILIDRYDSGFNDVSMSEGMKNEFLYDGGERNYGEDVDNVMHVLFADGAIVTPSKWWSVRSLGYLLYGVSHLMNRLRCKHSDAVFESLLWYFRNVTDGDMEKIDAVNLHHLGIIPNGLDFVPAGERHTIDPNLVGGMMTSLRQIMAESSATYVQDVQQRGSTPPSATQIIAEVNQSNALIGSMLTDAYEQMNYQYREVARRFATIDHKDCKRFRDECISEGVPPEVFKNFDAWETSPDRLVGDGNQMLAIASADRLMAVTPKLNPDGQKKVVRMYVESTVRDPAIADEIAPMDDVEENQPYAQLASLSWGTLMAQQKIVLPNSINLLGYTRSLLMLLDRSLRIDQGAGVIPSRDRVMGYVNAMSFVESLAVQLSQDQQQQEAVAEIEAALENGAELIKQWIEALKQQAAENGQPGINPEEMAKAQSVIQQSQMKAAIAEKDAEQKRRHAELSFQQQQQRNQALLASELAAADLRTKADIAGKAAKASSESNVEP